MPRPAKTQLIVTFSLLAALALPTAASAEYYIPPGNSGANQYTEALPGAGGDKGGKSKGVTPGEALGKGNAKRLEEKGPAGEAAAQLAADTAPAVEVAREQEQQSGGDDKQSGGTGTGDRSMGSDGDTEGPDAAGGGVENVTVSQPAGTSGVGAVLGEATGASDGNLGLWLPLAIVATVLGSILYRIRLRQGPLA